MERRPLADGYEDVKTATSPEDPIAAQRDKLRDFLRVAQERFKLAAEAEAKNRDASLDDLKFLAGDQWPDNIATSRYTDGRPCLTINRLPSIKRQITNEQRQQRPSIQVNPVGSESDPDVAEVLQGVIRHIEVNSDAEIAYDTGFEMMVTGGFGYWEVMTDYLDDTSFDQEIFIKRTKNPFTIYFDPSAIEPTYCDADWCFKVEDIPKVEYLRDYANSDAAGLPDFQSIGDQAPNWATKDTIRVAMYYHVEYDAVKINLLSNNQVQEEGQLLPQGVTVLRSRDVQKRKVVVSKINGIEVLNATSSNWQGQDWPGLFIPIIPVLGDDFDIDGKRHLAGIVRDAKDPQRMYNYWVSSGTEMIALAPRAPFVGGEGQFENHESQWANANTKNMPYLEYKPVSLNGTPLPPPARQTFEPPVQAITLMTRQADNDLKAVVGIFNPSLGEDKRDQSGKAVQLLQKQSDIGNLNFSDNLSRAIRWTGKILLDLIPKIYDAPRIQRIIEPDGTASHVGVYTKDNSGGMTPEEMKQALGVKKVYDIGTGRYDVTVSVGPSYQTKRQEAVAAQMALVQAYPQAMQIVGDLIVRNMDWPQAQEMADRLKKMLPQQLQGGDQSDPEAQLQQAQAQLQQFAQQHDLLVKALQDATDRIKTDQVKQQAQVQIAQLNNETKIAIAEISTKAQIAIERAKTVQGVWSELHGSAHDLALQKDQQGHEQDMAATQQDHEATMQDNAPQPAAGANGNG
jgi:hypothetical protein